MWDVFSRIIHRRFNDIGNLTFALWPVSKLRNNPDRYGETDIY